ncbi:hypothetical protein BC628DRAFT_686700 [Trametes gibbosa]|nr:hypothetical protein BC628DRAFT_686700 [Trametes gibbosa]
MLLELGPTFDVQLPATRARPSRADEDNIRGDWPRRPGPRCVLALPRRDGRFMSAPSEFWLNMRGLVPISLPPHPPPASRRGGGGGGTWTTAMSTGVLGARPASIVACLPPSPTSSLGRLRRSRFDGPRTPREPGYLPSAHGDVRTGPTRSPGPKSTCLSGFLPACPSGRRTAPRDPRPKRTTHGRWGGGGGRRGGVTPCSSPVGVSGGTQRSAVVRPKDDAPTNRRESVVPPWPCRGPAESPGRLACQCS